MSESNTTPNPGSDDAIAQGCSCPVIDNNRGCGRGDGNFWISSGCPVHAKSEAENFMEKQFANPEIKAVYERLAKR